MTTAYVLTHHSVPNFGANLQAYATNQALAARGIDALYVDFRPYELEKKYEACVSKAQRAAHADFCTQHFQTTPLIRSQSEFEALCRAKPADVYISGSDAVFRLQRNSQRADLRFPNPYWLVGAKAPDRGCPRRISIAPSAMGCDLTIFPTTTKNKISKALAQFDSLSARDPWTAQQLAALGAQPTIVPDPVFSLLPQLRKMRANKSRVRPYIVIGMQGRRNASWVRELSACAARNGIETIALPTPENLCDDGTTRSIDLPLNPLDWAAIIARSEGYIGCRFHPVVVALCAGVPAVSFDLYHKTPLERSRSKTWLIMQEFGYATACHSRLMHRLLKPRHVLAQLEAQRRTKERQLHIAEALAQKVNNWFDITLGPVIDVAHEGIE